jgi:hypothetical protein
LLGASIAADQAARTYKTAERCLDDDTSPGLTCYALVPGTLTSADISHGRAGTTADIKVQLVDGARETSVFVPDGLDSLLQPGAEVNAEIYQGQLTALQVGGHWMGATQNPANQQNQFLYAGVLLLVFGGIYLFGGFLVRPRLFFGGVLGNAGIQSFTEAAPSWQPDSARSAITLPLVLKPQARNGKRGRLVKVLPLLALLIITTFLRFRSSSGWLIAFGGMMLFGGVAYIALRWLYFRTANIFVDQTWAGKTTLWGTRKTVARADIARLVLCGEIVSSRYGQTNRRQVFFVGHDGRACLRINGEYWSMDDIQRLAAALNVPIDGSWNSLMTPDELRSRLPGSVSWIEAHPYLFGILITPVVLIVIGTLGVLLSSPK